VADHPWPVGRAFADIAKLLPDQRAEAMVVAMVPMIPRQILASHDLWLMSTALVALVRDPIVR
jgi:hypothetical protein